MEPFLFPMELNNSNFSSQLFQRGLMPFQVSMSQIIKNVPLSVFAVLLGILIIILNSLTLGIVLKERIVKEALRNVYLVNLLILNIFGGMAVSLLGAFYSGFGDTWTCLMFFNTNQWIHLSTLFNFIFLMLDQYVAIECPFKYILIMTSKFITASVIFIWVAPASFVFIFVYAVNGIEVCDAVPGNEDLYGFALYVLLSLAIVPFPLVILMNARIITIARRRANDVSALQVQNVTGSQENRKQNFMQRMQQEKRTFLQIWRSVLTATIMVGTMFLAVLPFSTIIILSLVDALSTVEDFLNGYKDLSASFISISINYLSSPVIYALRVPQVKRFYTKAFRTLCQCKCKRL